MKTPLLLCLLALFPYYSHGQYLTRLKEYNASNGKTYHVGDTVILAHGSQSDGDFKSLETGQLSQLFTTNYNVAKTESGYTKNLAGSGAVIKRINSFDANGPRRVVFAVNIGQVFRYNLNIENAIAFCEIKDCKKQEEQTTAQTDKYDQIKKLKSLLDSGAISQAEFDSEKKKILSP